MGLFDDDLEPDTLGSALKHHDPFGVTGIVPHVEPLVESKTGVIDSRDLRRVAALPRRKLHVTTDETKTKVLVSPELQAKTVELERLLRREDDAHCECAARWPKRGCAKSLRPIQALGLWEAQANAGEVGDVGVGDGKSLLDLLVSMVVAGTRTAVLLVPANLKHQMVKVNVEYYGQHWKLPNIVGRRGATGWAHPDRPYLHILSYEEVSNKNASSLLADIDPDLYILDECHMMKNSNTNRGRRFWPQIGRPDRPKTTKDGRPVRMVMWSGTLTDKSVMDYAELAARALGEGSPTPIHRPTAEEWAEAIDPSEWQKDMGQLRRLFRPGETVWSGWKARCAETPGWVSSPDMNNCKASLYFHERTPAVPEKVAKALQGIAVNWERPDGDPLTDILEQSKCLRQMACGFFYRWRWPDAINEDFRAQWLGARRAWRSEVRERLKRPRPHLDSPSLLEDAARRFHFPSPDDKPGALTWETEFYEDWVQVRDEFTKRTGLGMPETYAVWVDDFLVKDAAEWLTKHKGIVWIKHQAFGHALAKLSKAPLYLGGKDADVGIAAETGKRGIIASMSAHGTGKDLQFAFHENLFTYSMSSAKDWEQTLGRTHRPGQPEDQVDVWVYRHTEAMKAALDKAREFADYQQETMSGSKKLRSATYLFEGSEK